jgi:hypothetical protein
MNPQNHSILRLTPNVPVEIALQTPSGLEVSGQFGPQMLFSLVGNRRLYVPLKVGEEIRALTLAPGQPFILCKHQREGQRAFNWTVDRKAPDASPSHSGTPEGPKPATQIEHALKTAISAAHSAEKFATHIGYEIRFSEESIRAMAITLVINQGRAA